MTVYVIGQLSIHDPERYNRYLDAFMPIFAKYGGRVLAADDAPEVVEGQSGYGKVVLLEFPDRETFTAWATSTEYQEIAKDRHAAADGLMLLVRGLG